MAVEAVGNVYTENVGWNGSRTVAGIEIPVDASMAVMCLTSDKSAPILNSLYWNAGSGVEFTLLDTVVSNRDLRVYYMLNTDAQWPGPGAGNSLSYAFSENGERVYALHFLSGVDVNDPIVDFGQAIGSTNNIVIPTLTNVGSEDRSYLWVRGYNNTLDGTLNGQTEIVNWTSWNATLIAHKLAETDMTFGAIAQTTSNGAIVAAFKAAADAPPSVETYKPSWPIELLHRAAYRKPEEFTPGLFESRILSSRSIRGVK